MLKACNSKGITVSWWWIALPAALAYGTLLYLNDPERGGFLGCPFRTMTGLLCPGCGSQRALHQLMHGHLGKAFDHNALLVVAIPALLLQWAWGRYLNGGRSASTYNLVVVAWAMAIIGWGILRNT